MPAAGEPGLWTTRGDAEVKLRMGDSGLNAEPPVTIHQVFTSAVKRYGDYTALSWKDGQQQKRLNYREYYHTCRIAAKSFLKVPEGHLGIEFLACRGCSVEELCLKTVRLCSSVWSVAMASESWASTRPSGSSPTSAPFWRGECRCPRLLSAVGL